MSEYLLPFNNDITIEEKCELFAVKNRMINIPYNFSSKCEYKCKCGRKEDMIHIYSCEYLNKQEIKIEFSKIYEGNLFEKI